MPEESRPKLLTYVKMRSLLCRARDYPGIESDRRYVASGDAQIRRTEKRNPTGHAGLWAGDQDSAAAGTGLTLPSLIEIADPDVGCSVVCAKGVFRYS